MSTSTAAQIERRNAAERGQADHGWLKSQHSFSFAEYYDERHVAFGPLRVINEDRIEPGTGFGTHGHRDMEIVSYVLSGALEHRDSMGTGSVIRPGDVQRMSAGTGVLHSERNPSASEGTHFLQIWILPAVRGSRPSYEQKYFGPEEKRGRLRLVLSPDGAEGSVRIQQDARMYAGLFDGDESARLTLADGRANGTEARQPRTLAARLAYVHLVRGRLRVNGEPLEAGDALKLRNVDAVELDSGRDAEVLVFDLPAGDLQATSSS